MKEKNRTLKVFIILLLITSSLHAQSPAFEWAKSMGGTSDDKGFSIAMDANGNVYSTGFFSGTADFDPGAGTTNLTSNGSTDIFIQKLGAGGNLIWVKQIGGTNNDYGHSIATDANGNIYTAGRFSGTVDFDLGTGTSKLTSNGDFDIFIQKLDAGGNLLWVKQMGGIGHDLGRLTVDASGNVYTTGNFEETVDFDPGVGTANLISNGKRDIFIQKLDTKGNFLWVKQMGGTFYDDAWSIATDANGNVYTTGDFWNTVDFDPGTGTKDLTSNGKADIFIQKLDAAGNFLWVKQMGGQSDDTGRSISVDKSGNVYTTGHFKFTVDFDPGPGTSNLTAPGANDDVFIQKLDPNGNFLWVKQIGKIFKDEGTSIATDAVGNVYTTGYSDRKETYLDNSNYDVFIQKLDTNGNVLWYKEMGGPDDDSGNSIVTDASGNVYTTGFFQSTADFDPGAGTTNLTSNGLADIFIVKLSQPTVGISENTFTEKFQVYPNPTSGNFAIKFETVQKDLLVRIMTILGQTIETRTFKNTDFVEFELEQPTGIYLVDVLDEKGNRTVFRLIKK